MFTKWIDMAEVETLLRKTIDECLAAVERGADIPEIERLTTEIEIQVRQQSFAGMEIEFTSDGARFVKTDGHSRAIWRPRADTSTCE